jgi:hypothetical protein
VRLSGLDIVQLAVQKMSNKLLLLLAPHKIALLAIENQANKLTVDRILKATTATEKIKIAKNQIKAVQLVSGKLAYKHAVKEFALQNIEIGEMPHLDNSYIDRLNNDLKSSLEDSGLPDAEKARRAGLAAVSAANRSYTDMQIALYTQVAEKYSSRAVEKVWTTNKEVGSAPCQFCSSLDGAVVAVSKEFPSPAGLKVYVDLQGPPAHPNCKCRLVSRLGVAE